MVSNLMIRDPATNELRPSLDLYEYEELPQDKDYVRIIVLHPSNNSYRDADDNHVTISFSIEPLDQIKPFTAVKNSRGYRLLVQCIEVDGKYLSIPLSIERFLRYFRRIDGQTIRLWFRYLCLQPGTSEESRYWNREFVEGMYGRATDVVDMAAFNCELIDQNKTKVIYDSRYVEGRKKWGTLPEALHRPRVFAIRLGNLPVPNEPPKTYEHVPLDPIADEIRVVEVTGFPERKQIYEANLAHLPIRSEVYYSAISWTWGAPDQLNVDIIINGQKSSIWKTLANMFEDIQKPEGHQCLWIDAICINQKDIAERNRQLRRMSDIYYNAAAVVCYIGRPDKYSDAALDFVSILQQPMMRMNEEGEWDTTSCVPNQSDYNATPEGFTRNCAALYKLLTRPYFRRIWVVQEIAVSSNPTIACGSRIDVPFERLDTATYNLQDMLVRDPRWPQRMREQIPELAEATIHEEQLEYLRVMFYFRHLHSGGESQNTLFKMCDIEPDSPGMLETAILTRNFESTVPHDKIFAIWNLACDKDGFEFEMDYGKSYAATFTDFTRSWALFSGSLDVIGTAEPNPVSEKFYTEAPTWSTDWSKPVVTSCLMRREKVPRFMMAYVDSQDGPIFAANGCITQKGCPGRYFDFKNDMLLATGVILDSIEMIFPDPGEPPDSWRFYPPDLMSHWRACSWREEIRSHFVNVGLTTYQDPLQAAWAMFHGDDPEVWPAKAENPENADDQYPHERYVCLPDRSRTRYGKAAPRESRLIPFYGENYSRTVAWNTVHTILRGRVPVLTANGYMGLAPNLILNECSKEPLSIAILAACTVPILLRDLGDGTYEFCGTCFVQGWMSGNMLTSPMGVDTPEEFWEAMQGTDKLHIV